MPAEMFTGSDPIINNIPLKLIFDVQWFFYFFCSPFPERRFSNVATIKKIYVSKRFLSRDKLNFYFRRAKFKLSGFQYATN